MNAFPPMFAIPSVFVIQVQEDGGDLPNAVGVIFTTAKTAIQFHPDAIACIFVRTVVLISAG
jgi:hypothetical protein